MRVQLKWLPDGRKTPVPSIYQCEIRFTHDLHCTYPAVIHFPQSVRTYGDITSTDVYIPYEFYIIENGIKIAEACILQKFEPTLVRNVKRDGVLGWQVVENNKWVDVETCPPTLSLFHKTTVEYDTKLLRDQSCT